MSEEQLRELSQHRSSARFSDEEHLVLDYAVAMTRTPVTVPDALFSSLQSAFTSAQPVELTAAIAWENYRARFNHAFGAEAEGFGGESAVCVIPEKPERSSA